MSNRVTARRVVAVSLSIDVLDVVTNLVVVLLTGSAVIFAELAMGLADVFGSALLVVGERRARRPRDAHHPFGYGREVFFWALLSALVLLTVGGGLSLARGVQQVLVPEPVARPGLALAVVSLSIVTNSYAVHLASRDLVARAGSLRAALRSQAFPLVKTSFLRDTIGVLSSILGLVALIVSTATDGLLFDGLGAIAVGATTVVFAGLVIGQARALITGRAVPDDVHRRILASVTSAPHVVAVNRLGAVFAGGDEILVDLDLDLAEDLSTVDVEAVLDDVQHRVRAVAPTVDTIRVDLNSPEVGPVRRRRPRHARDEDRE